MSDENDKNLTSGEAMELRVRRAKAMLKSCKLHATGATTAHYGDMLPQPPRHLPIPAKKGIRKIKPSADSVVRYTKRYITGENS